MKKVKVRLLGNPYVEVDGERVNFPYKKAEGLFYYLCVRKNVTREEIIQVLWGGDSETVGRKNLREAVYQLKKLFGKDIFLTSGNSTISLNPEYMPEVDWDKVTPENVLELGAEGILSHFHIKNSYEFEEWIGSMQESLNRMYMESAQHNLYLADAEKDIRKIQQYSNMLIKQDPYNEKLYYEAMDIYAVNGNYNMAIKLYYDLKKVLKDELEVEPSADVTALFERIFSLKENTATSMPGREEYFFGRSEEMYRISESMTDFALEKHPMCIAICGDSGVGKSVLLEKAGRMARSFQMLTLSANCYQEEKEFFLRPWRDIFQEISQHTQGEESKTLERIFSRAVLEEGEKEKSYITYQAIEGIVLDMFHKLCAKYCVAIMLDDIQWMDDMSFRLLNRLVLNLGKEGIFVLCTFRNNFENELIEALDPLFTRDWVQIIELECFHEEDTIRIIQQFLPEIGQEEEKCREIYHLSEGNAFFLMESINLIREKGYTLERSNKVTNVIKKRLAGLPDEEKQVLDCISIFPEKVSIEEMELLLPMEQLDILRHLERLESRHLVKEILAGWKVYYTFAHRIFGEFIYEHQSVGKKMMCHQILAEYYEKKLDRENHLHRLPHLIYHYEKCCNKLKTYQYKVHYLKDFYTVIHENFPVLHEDMESTQELLGITPQATELMELAEEIILWEEQSKEAEKLKMEMHYVIGRYGISVGEYKSGVSHIQESIGLAEKLKDKYCLINCFKQLIFYGVQVQDLKVMAKFLKKGFAMISKEQESYQYGVFLRLKGLYHILRKEYETGQKLLEESIAVFENREEGQRRHSMNIAACYNYMGDICSYQKDYQAAYEYYCTAIETNTEKVITNGLAQFYSNAGQMLYIMGRYEEARQQLEKAISFFQQYGYRWGLGNAQAFMALLELHDGNRKEAAKQYEQAKATAKAMQNPETNRLLEQVKFHMESVRKLG